MKSAVIVIALLCVASATKWFELSEEYSFKQYVEEFGKKYASSEEFQMRKGIFSVRLARILEHNSNNHHTWKRGVNRFTDRTEEEYRQLLGVNKQWMFSSNVKRVANPISIDIDISSLPESVDWRDVNIITPVKDQGDCGSCWSFATAESIESYWALATNQLGDLSEQQILDCTPNPDDCGGTGGCGGGTAELAMQQIINTGGLSTEWVYPYVSYGGQNFNTCKPITPFAKLASFVNLPSNQYAPVISALATTGPMSISVDAGAWSDYETGVFDGCNQTHPDIDHAVQLVGYGNDTIYGPYWLVRNSWSPAWGEEGYIRLRRHTTHTPCGTDIHPSDGDGCKGGPSEITVCGTCAILFDVLYPVVNVQHKM